ncbi:MAG: hypothetical protein KR126chlam5_01078 [Candidatus Anoxychlamydiales bacterium]|nr:hypothetical protein [Candidatus Anoxychlamydiales bacterium]
MDIFNNIKYKAIAFGLSGAIGILAGGKIVCNSPESPQSLSENISVFAGLYIMALGVMFSFASNELFHGIDRCHFPRSKES